MIRLAIKNLTRRPLRTSLTVAGLALALGFLASLLSYGDGYQRGLNRELEGMGMQMMLVPLGCPFDAAARVLKGRSLDDVSLPEAALATARRDSAVAVAAPLHTITLPRPDVGRTDLWVGVDDAIRPLKPWWRLTDGSTWFHGPNDVLLGAEAAETELRRPGDRFFSPETGRTFTVCGVLQRSGTSDDSQFFVPIATAQAMSKQPGRLTAIAIRLRDPADLMDAAQRLQQVKGAQVVTLTEMIGTFLNLMGAARSVLLSIALIAVAISALTVFNTMMAAMLERTGELGVLRALGCGRGAIFLLMTTESLLLAAIGCVVGIGLAYLIPYGLFPLLRSVLPFAPDAVRPDVTLAVATDCVAVVAGVGLCAGMYPAWRASRLPPAVALAERS